MAEYTFRGTFSFSSVRLALIVEKISLQEKYFRPEEGKITSVNYDSLLSL